MCMRASFEALADETEEKTRSGVSRVQTVIRSTPPNTECTADDKLREHDAVNVKERIGVSPRPKIAYARITADQPLTRGKFARERDPPAVNPFLMSCSASGRHPSFIFSFHFQHVLAVGSSPSARIRHLCKQRTRRSIKARRDRPSTISLLLPFTHYQLNIVGT